MNKEKTIGSLVYPVELPVLTLKEVESIIESKWRHDFSKKALPNFVKAILEAQRDQDKKRIEGKE